MSKKHRKKRGAKQKQASFAMYTAFRTTYDTWMALYPNSSFDDWASDSVQFNLRLYTSQILRGIMNGMGKTEIDDEMSRHIMLRIVVIDEQYLNWLEQTGREHGEDSLIKYASTLSDAALSELIKKNNFDINLEVGMLSMVWETAKPTRKLGAMELPDFVQADMLKYLEAFFGKGNVFLPGWVGTPSLLMKYAAQIKAAAYEYFYIDEKSIANPFQHQRPKMSNRGNYYRLSIPFGVRWIRSSPYISGDFDSSFCDREGKLSVPATNMTCITVYGEAEESIHVDETVDSNIFHHEFVNHIADNFGRDKQICLDPGFTDTWAYDDAEDYVSHAVSRTSAFAQARADVQSLNEQDKLKFEGSDGPLWM